MNPPHSQEEPRIIVAVDLPDADQAIALVERLSPSLCRLKVGKALFTAAGPGLVRSIIDAGFQVFLDLKYHDIPNTVAEACRRAADLGVWMLNIHAGGGRRMMAAAREAVGEGSDRPRLIAVTVLTSMDRKDLAEIGVVHDPQEHVMRLATLAHDTGLDGVVCSAHEALDLRTRFGENFLLVTPGIRLPNAAQTTRNRQRRHPAAYPRHGSCSC